MGTLQNNKLNENSGASIYVGSGTATVNGTLLSTSTLFTKDIIDGVPQN